jgi:hypothetical protein
VGGVSRIDLPAIRPRLEETILFTRPDRFIAPAMQQANQPFGTRLQLLARLTLNAGKHPGNQPARLAQLDYGDDCAILVQGDEGTCSSRSVGASRHSVSYLPATMVPSPPRRLPHTISPLEGERFEPSVPLLGVIILRLPLAASVTPFPLVKTEITVSLTGTESSKPASSGGMPLRTSS